MLGCTTTLASKRETKAASIRVSDRIRQRLINARHRYHANDNISAFIEAGELAELRLEVKDKLQEVLQAMVVDTTDDHNTRDTACRVAKMFVDEVFRGRYQPAPVTTAFPNVSHLNELMMVGPIKVRSACSHHLCPILGRVWIGVLPNPSSGLMGLSKYARLAEWVMSRPQIQEEAVVMLADELEQRIHPDGLAIVMEADHFCIHWRGVKDDESAMKNIVMRGAFQRDQGLRRVFWHLVGGETR